MEIKKILKQRLSIFLSIIMIAFMVFGITPQMQTTTQAATTNISFYSKVNLNRIWKDTTYESAYCFAVEEKQTVQMNQMFTVSISNSSNTWKTYSLQDLTGVKYSLDSTKAATLSKQGVLKVKKPGIVKGTISYRGNKVYFVCKIVKAGKLGTNKAKYKKISNLLKSAKKYNGKVTTKNCYEFISTYRKIRQEYYQLNDIDSGGTLGYSYLNSKEKVKVGKGELTNWDMSQLVIPDMLAYETYGDILDKYVKNNNAVGTVASKQFKIKGVSAKKNTKEMTIVTSARASRAQIFAIKKYYSKDIVLENDKTAVFPVYVKDQNTGALYCGKAVAHEGNNKITVTMSYMKFSSKHKYQLLGEKYRVQLSGQKPDPLTYDWTRHKSIKVK